MPSPVRNIECIDTFMYQPQPVGTADDLLQLMRDLGIVIARQDAHNARHRPCVARAIVRPSDSVKDGAAHVVWVAIRQDDIASVSIDWVRGVDVAEERRCEEGWDICAVLSVVWHHLLDRLYPLVHDVLGAVAVHLKGIDVAIVETTDYAVIADCRTETASHCSHLGRQSSVI